MDCRSQSGLYLPEEIASGSPSAPPGVSHPSNEGWFLDARAEIHRFYWLLEYRDGRLRSQYERLGDGIWEWSFSRQGYGRLGVDHIVVLDVTTKERILKIAVPVDATVDILDRVSASLENFSEQKRVHVFGWVVKDSNPRSSKYIHFDPSEGIYRESPNRER